MGSYADELRSLENDIKQLVETHEDLSVRNEPSVSEEEKPKLSGMLGAFIDGREQSCTLMVTPDDRAEQSGYDIAIWTVVDPSADTINVRSEFTVRAEPDEIYHQLAEALDEALDTFTNKARNAYREKQQTEENTA